MRAGERRLRGRLVAELEEEADIAGRFVPDRGGAGRRCLGGIGDGGQDLVIDRHQLGGVFRLVERLRHDRRDRLAHMVHALHRQRPVRRHEVGLPVGPLPRHAGGEGAETLPSHVLAREDREHAR